MPIQDLNTTCFVIAPIGDSESDVRKRSDQVMKHIVRPAARNCGYEALRADDLPEPGIITSQIIQHIVNDPIVIADLTGRNPNVFYELAIRHALCKPYVQVVQKGERIPFDVAGVRTIEIDHRDLDAAENARIEIERQIRATTTSTSIETPISVAIVLDKLGRSEKPADREFGDILAALNDLKQIALRPSDPSLFELLAAINELKQIALSTKKSFAERIQGDEERSEETERQDRSPNGRFRLKEDLIIPWGPAGVPLYGNRGVVGISGDRKTLARKGDLVEVVDGYLVMSQTEANIGKVRLTWSDVEQLEGA